MHFKGNEEDFDFEKIDVIQRYFSKSFTVLTNDVRQKLLQLRVSKNEFKEIVKSIAFLPEEKQKDFLNEILELNHKDLK